MHKLNADFLELHLNQNDANALLQDLYEDAHLLYEHFGRIGNMSSLSLIRALASPILRKWICEKTIYKIQKVSRKSIHFDVMHNGDAIKICKSGAGDFWVELVPAFGINIGMGPRIKESKQKVQYEADNPNIEDIKRKLDSKAFCVQKMVFFNGKFFSRSDFVLLLANKLGGTHPRSTNFGKSSEVYEASQQMGLGIRKGQVFIVYKKNSLTDVHMRKKTIAYCMTFLFL